VNEDDVPFTTQALLDKGAERTGLLQDDLLRIAAKSAMVRHVARHPVYGPQFVLKGGTLLHHVYHSKRMSIADADYTYVDRTELTVPKIEEAFKIDGAGGFFLFPEQEAWPAGNEIFDGRKVPWRIEIRDLASDATVDTMHISISIRKGERIDIPKQQLYYSDPLLNGDDFFEVNGLTLEELAAEKLLGWCSKAMPKHAIDLAYIARDKSDELDTARVTELVLKKYAVESGSPRYSDAGIRNQVDLHEAIAGDALEAAADDWVNVIQNDLRFTTIEGLRPFEQRLTNFERVEDFLREFWTPRLIGLRG
jgi:predicted nucleotidyltransferase component of viral defense system